MFDDDFFGLSDEAWASYQRRVLRGPDATDTRRGVQKPPQRMKAVNRVGEPLIERWPSTQALPEFLQAVEFQPGCEFGDCQWSATHLTSWHPLNRCTHPVFGGDRLHHRLVCEMHLAGLERKAELECQQMNPRGLLKWFHATPGECGTCGMTIQLPTDILQVVRGI